LLRVFIFKISEYHEKIISTAHRSPRDLSLQVSSFRFREQQIKPVNAAHAVANHKFSSQLPFIGCAQPASSLSQVSALNTDPHAAIDTRLPRVLLWPFTMIKAIHAHP